MGFPAYTDHGFKSLLTKDSAPTVAPSPIVHLPIKTEFDPIIT